MRSIDNKFFSVWIDFEETLDVNLINSIAYQSLEYLPYEINKIPTDSYGSANPSYDSAVLLEKLTSETDRPSIIFTYRSTDKNFLVNEKLIFKSFNMLPIDISMNERLISQALFVATCIFNNQNKQSKYQDADFLLNLHQLNKFTKFQDILKDNEVRTLGRITYDELPAKIHVIFAHGIRTHAPWTEFAAEELKKKNIISSDFRYEWVDLVTFVFSDKTRKKLAYEFLKNLITKSQERSNVKISLVVHSYGTIILARALEQASYLGIQIDIDSIILNGSILPRGFDWKKYTSKIAQSSVSVKRVLNICGSHDIYPVLAKHYVRGKEIGDSGTFFLNISDDNSNSLKNGVFNMRLQEQDHSSILNKTHTDIWSLFLIDGVCARKGSINLKSNSKTNIGGGPSKKVERLHWLLLVTKPIVLASLLYVLLMGVIKLEVIEKIKSSIIWLLNLI